MHIAPWLESPGPDSKHLDCRHYWDASYWVGKMNELLLQRKSPRETGDGRNRRVTFNHHTFKFLRWMFNSLFGSQSGFPRKVRRIIILRETSLNTCRWICIADSQKLLLEIHVLHLKLRKTRPIACSLQCCNIPTLAPYWIRNKLGHTVTCMSQLKNLRR